MRPSIQHLWTRPPRVWAKAGIGGVRKSSGRPRGSRWWSGPGRRVILAQPDGRSASWRRAVRRRLLPVSFLGHGLVGLGLADAGCAGRSSKLFTRREAKAIAPQFQLRTTTTSEQRRVDRLSIHGSGCGLGADGVDDRGLHRGVDPRRARARRASSAGRSVPACASRGDGRSSRTPAGHRRGRRAGAAALRMSCGEVNPPCSWMAAYFRSAPQEGAGDDALRLDFRAADADRGRGRAAPQQDAAVELRPDDAAQLLGQGSDLAASAAMTAARVRPVGARALSAPVRVTDSIRSGAGAW